MASLAFQKFKALESNNNKAINDKEPTQHGRGSISSVSSSSSKYSPQTQEPPPSKKQKRRNLIGDLADRFESEEKKKQEEAQRKEFMRVEIERQEKAELERKQLEKKAEAEKKQLEQERLEKQLAKLEEERKELERKQKEDEANRRKEERRRKMEDEDQQYSNMKPAQALFARRIASKNNHDHSNKENRNNEAMSSNNRRIKDMKAKFFQQVENKDGKESHESNEISKEKSVNVSNGDISKRDDAPQRKQSGTDMFCDLYTKGNCKDIKNIFEQNIAVKKGFIPDPSLTASKDSQIQQPDLLKVKPNKVKTNASLLAKQFSQNKSDKNELLRSKEYIPINKKSFNHFLDKFEDDRSRQAAKAQLQQLTQQQKQYLSQEAPSWLKKQEEKERQEFERQQRAQREEEERIMLEEQKERLEYERKKKLLQEEEEKQKQKEIQELQERIEKEKKELLAAKKAAIKAKKEAKRKSKLGSSPPAELPKIVSNTYNDLKTRFDVKKGARPSKISEKDDGAIKRGPVVRKLVDNPFEQGLVKNEEISTVKRRELPVLKQNRIGDIKKRYTMFMTGGNSLDKETPEISNNSNDNVVVNQNAIANVGPDNQEFEQKIKEKPQNNILSPDSFLKTKAFLRLSAEKLSNSKEKLFKGSKEKIIEGNGMEGSKSGMTRKPSKNDMQNYLISKVLFDDKKPVSVVKQNDTVESPIISDIDEEVALDDEYIKEMEKYLMFIDDEYSTSTKKKKKKKAKKKQEPKIQILQVNHIKQQFETKKVVNNNIDKNVLNTNGNKDVTDLNNFTNEQGIGKLRQRFQIMNNEPKMEENHDRKPQPKRISRMINQDLLKKFDSPEMAEELKAQREKEREDRKRQRMAKLEEEKRLMEERKQEALRIEKERLRKEEERLEALRLEQLRIEEEQRLEKERQAEEARLAAAYEETVRLEKEKAAQRELKNLAIKSLREKNEPALKKKKVLGRIQHMFEKNTPESKDEDTKLGRIGSLKGKADGLFSNDGNNNSTKKSFQDPSLAGVGISLDKFKGKFEATNSEEPVVLSKGVTIKKKEIPSALIFEQKLIEQSKTDNNSPVRQNSTEWSWKKKDTKELAVQNTIAIHGESKEDQRKARASEREQRRNDQQRQLLDDIHQMNNRLMKKDAIKEHEQKMKEYGEFMSEIQNYLNEPDKSASESTFKDDIQNYINVVGSSIASNRARHKSNEKKITARKSSKIDHPQNPNQPKTKVGIQDIKNKLSESGNTFVRKEIEVDSIPVSNQKNSVKSMKQKLVDQYFSQMNNANEDDSILKSESGNLGVTSESISKTRGLFETKALEEQNASEQNSSFKKKSINVPSIFTQNSQNDAEEETSIRKSSYEWKYKKKSIQDFQKFINENKDFVPTEISQGCANIASKLKRDEKMEENKNENIMVDKNEERSIEEYNSLMKAVDTYLEAPDKSTKEINFKSEVERYLDLIEEPEPKCNKNSPAKNDNVVMRRPKKIDISQYEQNASRPQSQYENFSSPFDDTDSNKKPNSKSIKNLQNKLLAETGKSMAKEELQLHIAGADQMKKAYEKLNKPKDNTLLSAPKATLQKTFAQLKEEIVPEKSLESLKSEQQSTEWKWKQKSIKDLNTSIKMFKDHGINTPAKIEEQHKKLVQTNDYLNSRLAVPNSSKDAEEIKKLQDLRDQEIENFLQEMKSYIEKPSATNKESSLKSGITDYLDLIEDETNNMMISNQDNRLNKEAGHNKRNISLPKIGQVSNMKQILEKDFNDTRRDSGEGLDNVQEKWKRGKVDTSFFLQQENKDCSSDKNNKVVDPVILSSVNSSKIKEQLEAQYAKDEGKVLTSAPKRKLKTFEPQQVLETNNSTSTKAYLEVRAAETDYKKYKKLYAEQEAKIKEDKPKIESSYSNIVDENERKAAILAKYGCKPRPQRQDSDSSSSSTSSDEYDAEEEDDNNKVDENNIPLHIVQSNAMYAIYGDRLGDNPTKKNQKKKKEDSGDAILSMLRAMRQGAQPQNPHSGGPRKPRQDSVGSSDNDFSSDIIPGSCKDMKSKFEERPTNRLGQVAPPPPQRSVSQVNKRSVEKSTSCSNVRSMFESQNQRCDDDEPSKNAFRAAPLNKRVFEAFVADDDSPQSSPNQSGSNLFNRKGGIAKSSSFNKFKEAFESGKVYLNDDEEYTSSDNDVVKTSSFSDARMAREAELDELRSCPRLKRMFNINKPANRPSPLAKSSSSSAVSENLGLDEKTMSGVSQARSQIRNMFESSAPKVTFGQKLSEQVGEKSKQCKPPAKKQSNSSTEERTWVFDAINKYFDVIVEDDKEEEEEEEDDEDMDDEYDDSDEEDEGSPIFSSEVRCTASRFSYQTQPPPQEKSQYDIVRAEPVNVREIEGDEDEEDESDESDDDDEDEGLQFQVESEDDDDGMYDNTEQDISQRGFQLQKSTSSSKIRGHFHSVLMRSASGTINGNVSLSAFKANLRQHLQRRGSSTLSQGGGGMHSAGGSRAYLVDEPSDDDDVNGFSSDDDLQYDDAEEAIIETP